MGIISIRPSKEFEALIEHYHLKPQEIFRVGVACMLCDIGVNKYETRLNRERLTEAKAFLKEFEENREIQLKLLRIQDKIKEFLK